MKRRGGRAGALDPSSRQHRISALEAVGSEDYLLLIRLRLGGFMIRREHITAPELLFLSLAAAGVIGVVAAGLQLVFRAAG